MAAAKKRGFIRGGKKSGFIPVLTALAALGLAGPAQAQVTQASQEDVLKSLTYTFGGVTGIETISGLRDGPGGTITTVGVNGAAQGAGNGTTFRIGSQSKMFTATVMLKVMNDHGLSLDTTIADLMTNPAYSGVQGKLPPGIVERAGGLTLRQLLNMGTDLPNYLGGVPAGQSKSLFELWQESHAGGAANGYGSVTGFTSGNATAHTDMAGLALDLPPTPPPGGLFTGIYSNTNAILLALIAEGLTGQPFDNLLLAQLGATLPNTTLQTSQIMGWPTMIGTFNGQDIVNLDPTIPWTSGAVITNMEDLLTALELFNSDPTRMAPGNTTVINMHGMPTIYGLGLMSLDFKFISGLMEAPVALSPIVSIGHGGSIAGSGSFSGWLTATDGTPLDSGLVTYANVTNAFSRGGIYTETPAETLFVTLAEHLYRIGRADGAYNPGGGNVIISYGTTGGFSTKDFPGLINSLSFDDNGQTVPFIAYFDWDSLVPASLAINLDPVFTHYSQDDGTSGSEAVFEVGGNVTLPNWVRMEGYSGNKTGGNTYTLLELANIGATDNLSGQVAVYGSNATALKAKRAVTLRASSVIEAHGYNSIALELLSGANVVNGTVLGVGARITAVSVGDGLISTGVTIGEHAEIIAYSYGSSTLDFSGARTSTPLENGATGVLIANGSTATVKGQVTVWTNTPKPPSYVRQEPAISVGLSLGNSATATVNGGRVVSDGYGAHLTGNGSSLNLDNAGYLSGYLYSVLVKSGVNTAGISLANGSYVVGQIKVAAPGSTNASLTADRTSTLVARDYSQAAVDGVRTVTLNGTTVAWVTKDLPMRGQAITVIDNYNSGTFNYHPDFGDGGALAYVINQGQVTVNGLRTEAYRSPNASGIYDAWREVSLGTGYGPLFIGDADNLTHEPFVTLAGAALDAYRQNVGLARRALFPADMTGSVYSAPAYMSARPSGSDSGSTALAALYDRQTSASLFDGWAPVNPESRSLLAAEGGAGTLMAAPSAGGGPAGRPRFVFDYFHTRSSRDDNRYSGYDHDRDGLLLGAAVDIDSSLSLAGYFGWSKGEADFNYLRAEADTESTFAGFMGRWRRDVDENLATRFTGHFSLSRVDNDLERTVAGPGGLRSHLSGSFKQTVTGFGLEAALDWTPFGNADTRISPWLGLDYAHLKQNGLSETAADPAPTAMWADGFDADAVYTTLGAAVAHDFQLSDTHVLTVKGSAAWEHQFGDHQFTADGGFLAGGGSFQASSLAMDRDAAVLGLTVDSLHRLDNGDLFGLAAGYETRLMSGGHDQQFNLGLEYRF